MENSWIFPAFATAILILICAPHRVVDAAGCADKDCFTRTAHAGQVSLRVEGTATADGSATGANLQQRRASLNLVSASAILAAFAALFLIIQCHRSLVLGNRGKSTRRLGEGNGGFCGRNGEMQDFRTFNSSTRKNREVEYRATANACEVHHGLLSCFV